MILQVLYGNRSQAPVSMWQLKSEPVAAADEEEGGGGAGVELGDAVEVVLAEVDADGGEVGNDGDDVEAPAGEVPYAEGGVEADAVAAVPLPAEVHHVCGPPA